MSAPLITLFLLLTCVIVVAPVVGSGSGSGSTNDESCSFELNMIKDLFVKGIVSKEDYDAALRGHQAAVDATKSPEREEAEKAKIR